MTELPTAVIEGQFIAYLALITGDSAKKSTGPIASRAFNIQFASCFGVHDRANVLSPLGVAADLSARSVYLGAEAQGVVVTHHWCMFVLAPE